LNRNGLVLLWLADQRDYIMGAIGLVQQNILIGGLLAMTVLFLFLRRVSTTGIAAVRHSGERHRHVHLHERALAGT
jgi:hydrophobic/amphiphilic exporter-1 (mainly G- bacteria), HAE1 family